MPGWNPQGTSLRHCFGIIAHLVSLKPNEVAVVVLAGAVSVTAHCSCYCFLPLEVLLFLLLLMLMVLLLILHLRDIERSACAFWVINESSD